MIDRRAVLEYRGRPFPLREDNPHMSDNSAIEWTDATWNPVTGCTKVSPGCDHCYAETFAERWRGTAGHHFANGFDVTLRPELLGQPLRWQRARRVFVNSMSDLFHDAVPEEFIAEVFAVMAAAHWHTFQLLTKRHGRMRNLLNSPDFRELVQLESATLAHEGVDIMTNNPWESWPLPNVWIGCSVEDQRWADIRIPALLDTPAARRFLSCEPLLGPVELTRWLKRPQIPACDRCDPGGPVDADSGHLWGRCRCDCHPHQPGLDWVIAGGESGHQARPMHPDWARSLRDQCQAAGVPFFFKQFGAWAPESALLHRDSAPAAFLDADGCFRPLVNGKPATPPMARGNAITVRRVGKKAAGRLLDGRTWDEYPAVSA
jgi:protein gp37